jgi:hypothetical protein
MEKNLSFSSEIEGMHVLVLHIEGDNLHRVVGTIIDVSDGFLELETDAGVKHWISVTSIQKVKEMSRDGKR